MCSGSWLLYWRSLPESQMCPLWVQTTKVTLGSVCGQLALAVTSSWECGVEWTRAQALEASESAFGSLGPPLSYCVTLGELSNLLEPQFPHL